MRTKASLLRAVVMAFGLGLLATGGLLAQTQTAVDVRDFEVLAVDGNRVIFRDQKGTHDLTVPDAFRFKVDGRQMSAKELKPGMKGQATVTTTTTTITPVTVSEVREATVVSTTSHSVTVRGTDGVRRRFAQSELDKRGIEMIKDGRVIGISKLEPGDVVTATFISNEPPTVVTETEVDMKLAQAKVEPAADKSPSAAPVAAAPASVAPAQATPEAPSTSAPPQQSTSWLLWVAVLIALAALVAYFVRRKKG
ncbi:hypothetical protein [Rivibacter subsaxonicus]|uniref:LPXTG-motif cell wall-anchored protein n=1 Tax=Rivibacter subsaxonicus TaxID=457575 RepID=A0A4Q7VNP9_9BURK|nr:hypothetical protein [Rivibacter subsaxonicus]RZT97844.1 hypothetical protein EV670_2244 [Rivibacter subsaxonicus]